MKLGGIDEDELIALCEAMIPSGLKAEGLRGGRPVTVPTRVAASRHIVWNDSACGEAAFVTP